MLTRLVYLNSCHKATGPDGIPGMLLKTAAAEIAPIFRIIFNASLSQNKIPDDWRDAHVSPLFKKGDRNKPSNYRPVSLTSISCKIFEHILFSNIMKHFDEHNIITDYQHGFRKSRSCESQLLLTVQDIAKGLDEGKQIDAILLDFSKAFDKVPHARLLTKLDYYGVRGNTLGWIRDFLGNRTQKVILEGTLMNLLHLEFHKVQYSVHFYFWLLLMTCPAKFHQHQDYLQTIAYCTE